MDRQTMQYIAEDIAHKRAGEKLTAQLEETRRLLVLGEKRREVREQAALDNTGGSCAV